MKPQVRATSRNELVALAVGGVEAECSDEQEQRAEMKPQVRATSRNELVALAVGGVEAECDQANSPWPHRPINRTI